MDKAAEAIVDILAATAGDANDNSAEVFHVTSTSHTTSYKDVLAIAKTAGLHFDLVPPAVWLKKLDNARNDGKEHSCLKMLPTWERNVGLYSRHIFASSQLKNLSTA